MAASRLKATPIPKNDLYFGRWTLVPAESRFPAGRLLIRGTYVIEPDPDGIRITVEVTDAANGPSRVVYTARPDGVGRRYEHPGVTDAMRVTRVDARRLITQVLEQGQVVATAQREVSPDGKVLTITQTLVDGSAAITVYRREA
jgi:hypothetical protein